MSKELKMTLLSDAIPGSGEGIAGIIDQDIPFNEYGLPFIPAKRIKGILRESAEDLKDCGLINDYKIKALFGKSDDIETKGLRLSDGHLEHHKVWQSFFQVVETQATWKTLFHREAVLSRFTYLRAQTSMENGIAQKDTLRISRVLRKGLTFHFQLDVPAKTDEKTLLSIASVTRHFGISRTRGMGEIKLELADIDSSGTKFNNQGTTESDTTSVLVLQFTNLAQLLVSRDVGQSQVTQSYIPGSVLAGALVAIYHKAYSQDNSYETLIRNSICKFGNGWPLCNDKVLKAPRVSIVKEKDKNYYYDISFPSILSYIQENNIMTKGGISGFVPTTDTIIFSHNPDIRAEYHHRRPEDRSIGHAQKNEGEFYQFEVLEPGAVFEAEVFGPSQTLQKLKNALKDCGNLYVGKSKTAQYGRCKALDVKIYNEETSNLKWARGEPLYVEFLSETCFRNQQGFPVADYRLILDELAPNIKDKITIKAFCKYGLSGGFLGVWKRPKCQYPYIKPGSVLVLTNNTEDDINFSPKRAYGILTGEGFGRIFFSSSPHNSKEFTMKNKLSPTPPPLSDKHKNLAPDIQAILKDRQKTLVKQQALSQKKVSGVPNSFIGRLTAIIEESKSSDEMNNKLTKLKEPAQKSLGKVGGVLFVKNKKLDINRFVSEIVSQKVNNDNSLLKFFTEINKDLFEIVSNLTHDFSLYQIYALEYLKGLKFSNRNNGGVK